MEAESGVVRSQNFMKCLMRMHAKDNKGVLFFETIINFKQQRHTYIEAVPLPFEQFQDAPAYFRVSGVRTCRATFPLDISGSAANSFA